MQNLIVVDTETTGLNYFEDKLLSLALVPVLETWHKPLKVYIRYEEPLKFSTPEAAAYFEKYREEYEKQAVHPLIAIDRINEYIKKIADKEQVTLVGHNISFDLFFLNSLYYTYANFFKPPWSHRSVDTHSVLKFLNHCKFVPDDVMSLDKAVKHFGISLPENVYHTALADAQATKELYLKLVNTILDLDKGLRVAFA